MRNTRVALLPTSVLHGRSKPRSLPSACEHSPTQLRKRICWSTTPPEAAPSDSLFNTAHKFQSPPPTTLPEPHACKAASIPCRFIDTLKLNASTHMFTTHKVHAAGVGTTAHLRQVNLRCGGVGDRSTKRGLSTTTRSTANDAPHGRSTKRGWSTTTRSTVNARREEPFGSSQHFLKTASLRPSN